MQKERPRTTCIAKNNLALSPAHFLKDTDAGACYIDSTPLIHYGIIPASTGTSSHIKYLLYIMYYIVVISWG